jgi:hypothetical protein
LPSRRQFSADVDRCLILSARALDEVFRRMMADECLVFENDSRDWTLFRNEVPALAMLFRSSGADPAAREAALERAAALLTSGRMQLSTSGPDWLVIDAT